MKKYELTGLPAHCQKAYCGKFGEVDFTRLTDAQAEKMIEAGAKFLKKKDPPKKAKSDE